MISSEVSLSVPEGKRGSELNANLSGKSCRNLQRWDHQGGRTEAKATESSVKALLDTSTPVEMRVKRWQYQYFLVMGYRSLCYMD